MAQTILEQVLENVRRGARLPALGAPEPAPAPPTPEPAPVAPRRGVDTQALVRVVIDEVDLRLARLVERVLGHPALRPRSVAPPAPARNVAPTVAERISRAIPKAGSSPKLAPVDPRRVPAKSVFLAKTEEIDPSRLPATFDIDGEWLWGAPREDEAPLGELPGIPLTRSSHADETSAGATARPRTDDRRSGDPEPRPAGPPAPVRSFSEVAEDDGGFDLTVLDDPVVSWEESPLDTAPVAPGPRSAPEPARTDDPWAAFAATSAPDAAREPSELDLAFALPSEAETDAPGETEWAVPPVVREIVEEIEASSGPGSAPAERTAAPLDEVAGSSSVLETVLRGSDVDRSDGPDGTIPLDPNPGDTGEPTAAPGWAAPNGPRYLDRPREDRSPPRGPAGLGPVRPARSVLDEVETIVEEIAANCAAVVPPYGTPIDADPVDPTAALEEIRDLLVPLQQIPELLERKDAPNREILEHVRSLAHEVREIARSPRADGPESAAGPEAEAAAERRRIAFDDIQGVIESLT